MPFFREKYLPFTEAWKTLDPLTQTGVLTSELCLRTFSEDPTGIDFSASVMPIMKALENELIIRFYVPYLSFLKSNYQNADDYVRINSLESLEQAPEDARSKVVVFNEKQDKYRYRKITDIKKTKFTIGNFRYTAGIDKLSIANCDKTAVEFYKNVYFGEDADDSKVMAWICKLALELDGMRQLRNDSAHSGKTQSLQNAMDAMNVIIKVNRVLMMVVKPSL